MLLTEAVHACGLLPTVENRKFAKQGKLCAKQLQGQSGKTANLKDNHCCTRPS